MPPNFVFCHLARMREGTFSDGKLHAYYVAINTLVGSEHNWLFQNKDHTSLFISGWQFLNGLEGKRGKMSWRNCFKLRGESSPLPVRKSSIWMQMLVLLDSFPNVHTVKCPLIFLLRNLPVAISISARVVTVLYLLTNVAYDVILLMPSLLTNDAVAVVNLKGSTDLWLHWEVFHKRKIWAICTSLCQVHCWKKMRKIITWEHYEN